MRQLYWGILCLLVACQAQPMETLPIKVVEPNQAKFTVADASVEAFSHRFADMNEEHRTAFFSGESLFDQNWVTAPSSTVARDGLGPLFNARGCAACHVKDGRGKPFDTNGQSLEALLVRLSQTGASRDGGPLPDPVYGGQLQPFALQGQKPEGKLKINWQTQTGKYPDGQSYELLKPEYQLTEPGYGEFDPKMLISVRQTPILIGMGLLEKIPEAEIQALTDPTDHNGDGISGKANVVWNIAESQKTLGRFGWKANQPTVRQQVAGAFAGDIGITSPVFTNAEYTQVQSAELKNLPDGGQPELDERLLQRVVFYTQNLAIPARRNSESPDVKAGETYFLKANCQSCHHVSFQIENNAIHPYTDLLLHDLGPELADGRPDYEASGSEWRTAPLWGMGLIEKVNGHSRFLHDGRARNLEEAVLWHAGEANASRQAFMNLSANERKQFLRFLESL